MRQVLSFFSIRRTGSKFRDFEDAEEKQTADQSTAVNPMHFLSHTDLEKIINNWFRTNIPFVHQVSSSFILLGSKKKTPPNTQTDKLQQMFLQDISDIIVCWKHLYNQVQSLCAKPSWDCSLMTMMSWFANGNVHLYKVLEVIKIQFTHKGDIKEKFSGQIGLQDLLGKKASLLLGTFNLGELLNCMYYR